MESAGRKDWKRKGANREAVTETATTTNLHAWVNMYLQTKIKFAAVMSAKLNLQQCERNLADFTLE